MTVGASKLRQLEAMSFCVRETKACCARGLVQPLRFSGQFLTQHIPKSQAKWECKEVRGLGALVMMRSTGHRESSMWKSASPAALWSSSAPTSMRRLIQHTRQVVRVSAPSVVRN